MHGPSDELVVPMDYQTPLFNVRAVVEKTGVQSHTLRAWERRYGLPHPGRSEGGHRLYSKRDLDIIGWLLDRLGEGLSIGRAVELWKHLLLAGQEPTRPVSALARPASAAGDTIYELRWAWVEACLAFDEARADRAILEALALFDPETAISGVMQEGLSQIGDLWYAGGASAQQEHLATELAIRRVESLLAASPQPSRPGRILTACPPEELHSFSLLLVAFLLRRRGWNVIHLGSDVPLARLEDVIALRRPDLVVSAAQQLPTAATLLEMATYLRGQGVAMAYGGWVFNRLPELRRRIPGHFLGEHIEHVPANVEVLLGAPMAALAEPLSPERLQGRAHFAEQSPLIEAETARLLQGSKVRGAPLALAMQHLPASLSAALTLCALDYVDFSLDWIAGLLVNRGLPDSLLAQFLEAYTEAAGLHLDERAEAVVSWLTGRLDKGVDRATRETSSGAGQELGDPIRSHHGED